MFLEHLINILEWFLKDHVTLKTEVMLDITGEKKVLFMGSLKFTTKNVKQMLISILSISASHAEYQTLQPHHTKKQ